MMGEALIPLSLKYIPTELLVLVVTYLPKNNLPYVAIACSFLNEIVKNESNWRIRCDLTHKSDLRLNKQTTWLQTYRHNDHVPVDIPTLQLALTSISPNSTIIVDATNLPPQFCSDITIEKVATVRVFPSTSTITIMSPADAQSSSSSHSSHKNKPIIRVVAGAKLTLNNCRLLHSSSGSDIWRGNCAVYVNKGEVTMNDCAIMSRTGRGLINVSGGVVTLKTCTVHDCAATGVYVGDAESSCNFQLCNIVRCGRGGGDIPHGHSGVYVETGKGSVVNSFIGDNALTGVTVVRGGQVVLKDCDIVSNGAEAVTIEDIDRGTAAMLENNCMQNNGQVPDVSPETFDDSSRRFDCKGLRGPSLLRKIAEGLEATTEPEGIDHDAAEELVLLSPLGVAA